MCVEVFVGSDSKLEEIPWNEKNPSFNSNTSEHHVNFVRPLFSKRYIACVAAHGGCGCDFTYNENSTKEGIEEAKSSFSKLKAYLLNALEGQENVELFAFWDFPRDFKEIKKDKLSLSDFNNKILEPVDGVNEKYRFWILSK